MADIGLHHLVGFDDVVSQGGLHEDGMTTTSARLNDGQLVIVITIRVRASGAGARHSSPCGIPG